MAVENGMETVSQIPICDAQREIEKPPQPISPPVPHGSILIDESVLNCMYR
jgi:hypothetical protein